MKTTKRQAKSGGEIGANGALYKGGQFINENPANPQNQAVSTPKRSKKVEVAPYQWVLSNFESDGPTIWSQVQNFAKWSETSFKSGNWMYDRNTVNYEALAFYNFTIEEFTVLADRFEAGDRFVKVATHG